MDKQVSVAEIYIICKGHVTSEEAEKLAQEAKNFLVSYLRKEKLKDISAIYSTTYVEVLSKNKGIRAWLTKLFI